jgi:competence protein ComFC
LQMLLDKLAHIFLPNQCMFCHASVTFERTVCGVCVNNAPLIPNGICIACGKKKCACGEIYFEELVCPFYYELGVDIAIQDMKFHQNRMNARKLAIYMAQALQQKEYCCEIDMIIPSPMYQGDKRKRGYNQAELLARWISKYTNIPMRKDILYKYKKTKKQHELNFAQRQKNLENAFYVRKNSEIEGKTILLCDDVFTTGATLNTCSKLLIENKVEKVYLITAARTRIEAEVL